MVFAIVSNQFCSRFVLRIKASLVLHSSGSISCPCAAAAAAAAAALGQRGPSRDPALGSCSSPAGPLPLLLVPAAEDTPIWWLFSHGLTPLQGCSTFLQAPPAALVPISQPALSHSDPKGQRSPPEQGCLLLSCPIRFSLKRLSHRLIYGVRGSQGWEWHPPSK